MSAIGSTVGLYLRAELLKRYFLVETDDTIWVALTRTVAQANATGDQLDEPEGTDYQRAPYGLGPDLWTPSGFGEVLTLEAISFGVTATDWGLITGWALVTDDTSGVTLSVGRMTNPGQVVAGEEPVIYPGAITVGLYD